MHCERSVDLLEILRRVLYFVLFIKWTEITLLQVATLSARTQIEGRVSLLLKMWNN